MPSNTFKLQQLNILDEQVPAKPCGFYVLVEVIEVETESEGGIYLGNQAKEQKAEEIGYVRAMGPTAYKGWQGCDTPTPWLQWGINIGDMVEFRAFEGKECVIPGFERWRYIPDSQIVGRVNAEQ